MNYIVVTCHYIDEGWMLNKKYFIKSDFGSQAKTIGKNLETCLKEWGIKKVCCVTIDNAKVNNVAFTYLIREMSDIKKKIIAWNTSGKNRLKYPNQTD
jgi:hypothetical protein